MLPEATHTGTEVPHEKGGLPQLDPAHFAGQIFWLAVTFVFLYVVMSRLTLPRIGQTIETRKNKISGDLVQAAELGRKSEDALKSYEKALAEAKAKARAVADEARKVSKGESDKRRAEAEATLNEKIAATERRIAETKQAALLNVRGIASETAGAIVERLLGRTATRADAERAVDEIGRAHV